jgi:hypothetical protein
VVEPIHDPTFGRLDWDRLLDCWLGGIDWPAGSHTEVAIWPLAGDTAAGLRRARDGLGWLKQHEGPARLAVAAAMTGVYNRAWRGDGEPITAADLARRTELLRVGFQGDGSLLLSYDGGGLFGGHVIDGVFGADRSFGGATLVG